MKKMMIGLAFAALALPFAVSAAEDAELAAQCKQYAVEDKIPAEDMEQFMKECMGENQPQDNAPADGGAAPTQE
jgi:hypothetical protein